MSFLTNTDVPVPSGFCPSQLSHLSTVGAIAPTSRTAGSAGDPRDPLAGTHPTQFALSLSSSITLVGFFLPADECE